MNTRVTIHTLYNPIMNVKVLLYNTLRRSERFFRTDMVYLAKGGFWLGIGQATTIITVLITSVAFANLIPPEVYGQYKYVLSMAGIIVAFSLSGMGTAVTQAVARGFEGSLKLEHRETLIWGLGMTAVAWGVAIYYFLNDNNFLAYSMLAVGLFQPLLNSANLFNSFLYGKKSFKESVLLHVIRSILFVLVIVSTLFLTDDPLLIVIVYFTIHTVVANIFYFTTKHKHKPNNHIDPKTSSYGKHLSVMYALAAIAYQIDKLLVFHFLGATQLAIYVFAIAIPDQLKASLKSLSDLILPKFAEKNKLEDLRTSVASKTLRAALLFSLITIVYIAIAPYLFSILFPAYSESVIYSQIFALSFITTINFLPVSALNSQMQSKLLYKLNISTAIIQISSMVIGVYYWGIMGIIVARVLTRTIHVTLAYVLLWVK